MNERTAMISKLVSTHIVLPVTVAAAAFVVTGDAFLVNVMAQTILLIVYLAGYWEFFGMKLRRLFPISLEILLLAQLAYRAASQTHFEYNLYLADGMFAVEVFLLIQLVRIMVVILKKDKSMLEIEFPLRSGKFLITDGGNSSISRLMNYHYWSPVHRKNDTYKSMLYATDIVKIVPPYPSFLPPENTDYPIFGEPVYCPIDGTVVKVEHSIADNRPYSGNYPYNTGNTVVIRKDDLYFLLGHLKEGSVMVKVGDVVTAGRQIALAGNSGMSERPHIHIQLVKSESDNFWPGTGVSIQYGGKNLYKNRVIST
jgi:Peptidase family M23